MRFHLVGAPRPGSAARTKFGNIAIGNVVGACRCDDAEVGKPLHRRGYAKLRPM